MCTRAAPSIILISTLEWILNAILMAPNISINLIRSYGGLFRFIPRIGAKHDFHEQRRHPGHFPETGKI